MRRREIFQLDFRYQCPGFASPNELEAVRSRKMAPDHVTLVTLGVL
jgi:hypothetical protein